MPRRYAPLLAACAALLGASCGVPAERHALAVTDRERLAIELARAERAQAECAQRAELQLGPSALGPSPDTSSARRIDAQRRALQGALAGALGAGDASLTATHTHTAVALTAPRFDAAGAPDAETARKIERVGRALSATPGSITVSVHPDPAAPDERAALTTAAQHASSVALLLMRAGIAPRRIALAAGQSEPGRGSEPVQLLIEP